MCFNSICIIALLSRCYKNQNARYPINTGLARRTALVLVPVYIIQNSDSLIVSLIMFYLNMVDYPMFFLSLSTCPPLHLVTVGFWAWTLDWALASWLSFVWIGNRLSIYFDQGVSPLRSVWNFSSNSFNELIMMVVANFQCWTFQVQIGLELFHWDKLSVTPSLLNFVTKSYFRSFQMSAQAQNPPLSLMSMYAVSA